MLSVLCPSDNQLSFSFVFQQGLQAGASGQNHLQFLEEVVLV